MDSAIVSLMLAIIFGEIRAHGLPLGVGVIKGRWLKKSSEGKQPLQNWSPPRYLKVSDLINFTVGRYVQHQQTAWRICLVSGGGGGETWGVTSRVASCHSILKDGVTL